MNKKNKKKSIFSNPAVMLPLLICLIGVVAAGTSSAILFGSVIDQRKSNLTQMVSSQVALMEAVAQFDTDHSEISHPDGSFGSTMGQIVEAHKKLDGFGSTGEFVIGRLIDGKVALLQKPRFEGEVNFKIPEFVPIPMQRALSGEIGEIIATDYKGNQVLASYAPVGILNIGLVAKVDTSEVYQPFVVSGGIITALTLVMLIIGVYASRKFSLPFTQLEYEKKRAESYLEMAGAMIVVLDKNGHISTINRRGCEVLGYEKNFLVGKNWFKIAIPEEQREQIKKVFAQFISGDLEPIEYYENEIIDSEGNTHVIAWHNSYIKNEHGEISGFISAGEDITEKQKYENELKTSRTRFDKSQEFANVGTWDWDVVSGELYWSSRIAPLFGYAKGELETTYDNFLAAIHPDDRQAVTDAVTACVETGAEYNIEHRTIWPDGTVRWLHESGDVVRDDDGAPLNMLGVVQDITERKLMQEQLIQSSKMATLGEMATGVAHELNQPLNVILMAVGNIQKKIENNKLDEEHLKTKLDKVNKMVERAALIIDHMRVFGRTTSGDVQPLSPVKVIMAAMDLIGEQLRLSDIEVTTDFDGYVDGEENLIHGHQIQIEQVLLNLLANARDAIKEKTDGEKHIRINVKYNEGDKCVLIEVEDGGGGIKPQHMDRIFEPFYTTKEVGEGTGLGLSISYGIIADMGGKIEAENTDIGARFIITLPAYKREQAA